MKYINASKTGIILMPVLIIFVITSCKKFVVVAAPTTSLTGSTVYSTDATSAAVLTGLYTSMSQGGTTNPFTTGINSISLQTGLSADELTLYAGSTNQKYIAQYKNALTNTVAPPFWQSFYFFIENINSLIQGVSESSSLTPAVKQHALGEAKFMRAFCYFYLVNLYGDVPMPLEPNYETNALLSKTPKAQVYQQIISDLSEAQSLLTSNYLDATDLTSTSEKVRPNKWAATALLARAYLYSGNNWIGADSAASAIINSSVYSLSPLIGTSNVFTKNSSEAIWQLQPVNSGWNTEDARTFILTGAPSSTRPVYLSSSLLNSFEAGDLRLTKWVGQKTVGTATYFFPFKYQSATSGLPVTEYLMILRLTEQYLIRAEARAQEGNISGAQADLNLIRNRAGLSNTTANDKASLLTAILHERQVELFTEWGHRWLDLKRTGNVDVVMTPVTLLKGGTWNTNWQLFPIPLNDIRTDLNLQQNPGY